MTTIRDIHNPWRDALLPAMFDGVPFFCESGIRESGRRTVIHEYPKRDLPYSEDMGRRAIQYTVRGYVIQFGKDAGVDQTTLFLAPTPVPGFNVVTMQPRNGVAVSLYMRDYRIARDMLQARLDAPGQGVLQLPNMGRAGQGGPLTLTAICTGYRMTEEDRFGGYCVFDMTFAEYGLVNSPPPPVAATVLQKNTDGTYSLTTQNLVNPAPVYP